MAHKCINTRDVIKSNGHWRSNGFCLIKEKDFVLEIGSINEIPIMSFHT